MPDYAIYRNHKVDLTYSVAIENQRTLRRFTVGGYGDCVLDVPLFHGNKRPETVLIYGYRESIDLIRLVIHGHITHEGPADGFEWMAYEQGLTVLSTLLPIALPVQFNDLPVSQIRLEIVRKGGGALDGKPLEVGVVYANAG